jgi:hypothetical protein
MFGNRAIAAVTAATSAPSVVSTTSLSVIWGLEPLDAQVHNGLLEILEER